MLNVTQSIPEAERGDCRSEDPDGAPDGLERGEQDLPEGAEYDPHHPLPAEDHEAGEVEPFPEDANGPAEADQVALPEADDRPAERLLSEHRVTETRWSGKVLCGTGYVNNLRWVGLGR